MAVGGRAAVADMVGEMVLCSIDCSSRTLGEDSGSSALLDSPSSTVVAAEKRETSSGREGERERSNRPVSDAGVDSEDEC